MKALAPELLWDGGAFVAGRAVVPGDDGRVAAVRAAREGDQRLERRALLPGFVGAHSHAFQRGLRGKGERFPAGAGSFWSWREAMYALVEELDPERLFDLTRQAYEEMLAAGITAVGEFHYVHHAAPPAGARRDWELDQAVVAAGRAAGIRQCLLQVYYRTGAIGKPLAGAQRRFDGGSPQEYLERLDALLETLDPRTQTAGMVVHSVRAAPLEDLRLLHAESVRRGLPFHMHLEEQRREVEDCLAAHGRRPLELVLDELLPDERFTCVHGTHARAAELARLGAAGASLCVCPTTEANLGDGIPDLAPFLAAGGRLCLGTDSNARISMLEELRWLEYGQRLRREERGLLADGEGAVAPLLLEAATAGGARSLALEAGRLAPGAAADLVELDLEASSLCGVAAGELAEALAFGAGDEVVAATWVAGRRVHQRGGAGA